MRVSARVFVTVLALTATARAQRPPPFFESDDGPLEPTAGVGAARAEPGLPDYDPRTAPPQVARRAYRVARPKPPIRTLFGVAAGGGYRSLYGPAYAAGVVDLQVGLERVHFEMLGHITVESGAVVPRIPITQLRFGVSLRGIWRQLRVGGGLRIGALMLSRVTTGEALGAIVLSPFISFSGDLFAYKRAAFFLGAEGGVDLTTFLTNREMSSTSDGSWVLTGLAGARF